MSHTPGFATMLLPRTVNTWQWIRSSPRIFLCRVLMAHEWVFAVYILNANWRLGDGKASVICCGPCPDKPLRVPFKWGIFCYITMTRLSWQMHLRLEFFQNAPWTVPKPIRSLRPEQRSRNRRLIPVNHFSWSNLSADFARAEPWPDPSSWLIPPLFIWPQKSKPDVAFKRNNWLRSILFPTVSEDVILWLLRL